MMSFSWPEDYLPDNTPDLATGVALAGVIVRNYGLYFDVATDAGLIRATLRGILKRERRKTDPAAVGDRVCITVTTPEQDPPEGVIEEVKPRQRALSRLARGTDDIEQVILANPDQLLAVFAISEPEPHPRMIDRFLLIAEARGLEAAIAINKLDLARDAEVEELAARFESAGYSVFPTSVTENAGLDMLREYLIHKITAFAGPSGVGKSSMLNALVPGLDLPIGEISDVTGKGRHTTTWTTLFQIDRNTFVADTPGMRQLGLWGVDFDHLDELFPEFRPHLGRCYFSDCRHLTEPGCAVREALDAGLINADRYDSYRRLRLGDEEQEVEAEIPLPL